MSERPPLHLLIKPASSLCNLRCRYCFYHSLAEKRSVKSFGVMSEETLRHVVGRGCREAGGSVTFAFQGGEPTLAGLPFFEAFEGMVAEFAPKNLRVDRALQTNGTLLTPEWAAFLRRHRYLVGLSLDGPAQIHDGNRADAQGKGTHARVLLAAQLLRREGVDFNVLSVVTGESARHARKTYSFLRKSGFEYLQFIPCLDPLGEEPGGHPWSLTAERYGQFLMATFDLWYEEISRGVPVSVRLFDNLVGMLAGNPPESCGMSGLCACQCVVEADGGVYPCDFYVDDGHLLGNIRDTPIEELRRRAEGFLRESEPLAPGCRECAYSPLCRGGCRRYREPFAGGAPSQHSLCAGLKAFYAHALPRMQRLASRLR